MFHVVVQLSHHSLNTLNLSINQLGPAGAELLARILCDNQTLQHLNVAQNDIGSAGMDVDGLVWMWMWMCIHVYVMSLDVDVISPCTVLRSWSRTMPA